MPTITLRNRAACRRGDLVVGVVFPRDVAIVLREVLVLDRRARRKGHGHFSIIVSTSQAMRRGRHTAPGRVIRGRHEEGIVDRPVLELRDGTSEIQILYESMVVSGVYCRANVRMRRTAPRRVVLDFERHGNRV